MSRLDQQMNIMRESLNKLQINSPYPPESKEKLVSPYPPEAPKPICWKSPPACGEEKVCNQLTETPCFLGTHVTSDYIRNRGNPTYFDCPTDPAAINNPAPVPIYVRITDCQSPRKFIINSRISPRLILKRGSKYQLNVVTDCCPFYFSTKPGGSADIFGIPPNSYDTRTYVIDNAVPSKFYYTSVSGKDSSLVGEVIVV